MPGGDDLYDDPTDIDDSLLEMLMLVGLAATLAFLLYWRQQRRDGRVGVGGVQQQQQQGGEVQQEEQQEDRGVFPRPGDPDFPGWVAGGVGH